MFTHQGIFDFTHFPTLKTQRLFLRKITPDDVNSLLKLFGNPEVVQFIETQPIKTLEQADEWLKWLGGAFAAKDGLRWGITLHDGTFIGSAGLSRLNREAHYAEISCDINHHFWGQGYGQEAMREVMQFGWEQMSLNRIEATVVKGNTRSVHVMEKLGFKKEGLLRQRLLKGGTYFDIYIFALLHCEITENC